MKMIGNALLRLDSWLLTRIIPFKYFEQGYPTGHPEHQKYFEHNRRLHKYAIAYRKLANKLGCMHT